MGEDVAEQSHDYAMVVNGSQLAFVVHPQSTAHAAHAAAAHTAAAHTAAPAATHAAAVHHDRASLFWLLAANVSISGSSGRSWSS